MNKIFSPPEEGETKTGCFSDDSNDHMYIDSPICPKCGSRDYQMHDDGQGNNCQCADCGWRYSY